MATIIDGKILADQKLENLKVEINSSEIRPKLAVIQIGENPASTSYIRQKQKAAEKIGAELVHVPILDDAQPFTLKQQIEILNDEDMDGIIIQRPVPKHLQIPEILNSVSLKKDVDGFLTNSPFFPPVTLAVLDSIIYTYSSVPTNISAEQYYAQNEDFRKYISSKDILIIGVGETAGSPVHRAFDKLGIKHATVDKLTPEDKKLFWIKTADILIGCVGIPNLIIGEMIKKNAICIGVGISRSPVPSSSRSEDERASEASQKAKLVGDFEEESISEVASFYTPTPGGIGPLNVAYLMSNLVKATKTSLL